VAQRVTTIVPTFRRPAMMARAVRSALSQTYENLQVDIYDNGSDDETSDVAMALAADDPRVRYHRRPTNIGMVENFADAQRAVTTEYFSFLADDDVLLPHFYQRAVDALNASPEAMFVASPVPFVDRHGRILQVAGTEWPAGLHRPPEAMLGLLSRGHFVWTGTLFRRTATERVGTLDPKASVCSDLDFQLRLAGRFPFLTISEISAIFFWHEDSATSLPRLPQFWPTWEWIASKLTADETLPLAQRLEAARILRERLPGKVFLAGVLASSLGRHAEAQEAASLLADRFTRPAGGLAIRLLDMACRQVPPFGRMLAALAGRVRWRKRAPSRVQADFTRRYGALLALPAALPDDHAKDSAA
jgi:hypothetical protein